MGTEIGNINEQKDLTSQEIVSKLRPKAGHNNIAISYNILRFFLVGQ